MAERYFTPTEVNRLIPDLERIIKYIRTLETEIQENEWRLKKAKVEASRRGGDVDDGTFLRDEAEIDFLRILAHGQFDRVRALGGDVKGGFLVDFLGKIDDRDVLLCWKPGERSVRWYHGLHEGMGGRKPIPDQALGQEEDGEAAER